MTQAESTQKKQQNIIVQNPGFKFLDRPDQHNSTPTASSEKVFNFAQDLLGVLLLAFGAVLLLGVLGLTKGGFITPLVLILKQSFGIGRFIFAFAVFISGASLLLWRKSQARDVKIGKVLLLELSFFLLLGVFSCFVDMSQSLAMAVSKVRDGSSLGGIVGFGMSIMLVNLIGRILTGLILLALSIILFLFGSNQLANIERWAARKAGLKQLPSARSAQYEALEELVGMMALPEPVASVPATEPEETVIRRSKPTPQNAVDDSNAQEVITRLRFSSREAREQSKQKLPERHLDLPPLTLLAADKLVAENQATINMNAGLLEQTLAEFGVPAKVIGYRVGPTVTQYAVEPGYLDKAGDEKHKVRISQISALSRDLALALKAERLRIEAPVPGESYVGVEVPNSEVSTVRMRSLLESPEFLRLKAPLALPLGRDVSGLPLVSDLSSMPHLLIAGTTNSGKSVCIQAITLSLVMNNHPDDLKLVMIDPKRVELNRFNGLPHLLGQVETNTDRIMGVLRWATTEMDARYQKLEKVQARNLDTYNTRMRKSGKENMPRVVILIDELADLMMSAREETETALVRLAQKARAVGMHLVVATQRPSADVITGLIKANFPSRIAFTVASSVDSRVILDANGAETLLGKGDMLLLHPAVGIPQRAQGVMVSDKEIKNVSDWWARHSNQEKQSIPIEMTSSPGSLPTVVEQNEEVEEEAPWEAIVQEDTEKDSEEGLINEAIALVRKQKRASASFLQRQMRIGYPKAAWLIDQLEARGVIGEAQSGGREREILEEESDEME